MRFRSRVGSVLAGDYSSAGLPPPTVHGDDLSIIANELRECCGNVFLASPEMIADALGMHIIEVEHADDVLALSKEQTIVINAQLPTDTRNLCVLLGAAQSSLAERVGLHTEADRILLAAETCAPAALVRRRGVGAVVALRHAPEWFLRRWERTVLGSAIEQAPVSSWTNRL